MAESGAPTDDDGRPIRPGHSTLTLQPRRRLPRFTALVAGAALAAFVSMRAGGAGRVVFYAALLAGVVGLLRIAINLGVALPGSCWLRLDPRALTLRAWWRTRAWPWAEIEAAEPALRGFFVRTACLRLRGGRRVLLPDSFGLSQDDLIALIEQWKIDAIYG